MSSVKTFIARQPIFDKNKEVYAYELLFRHQYGHSYDGSNPECATSRVILDNLLMMDLDQLLAGKPAFVNATRETLIKEHMTLLPKEKVIIEIVESIEPDAEVINACKRLKKSGFLLALDDFCDKENQKQFLPFVDIVKVDFLLLKIEDAVNICSKYSNNNLLFLAEKLETIESYKLAYNAGYDYFQGYYFEKPSILTGKRIAGSRARYLDLLHELSLKEIDFERLENIIKHDLSISYRILRYINSAFIGLKHKVSSLKQALVLLGKIELKKWISVVALASLTEDKPNEIFIQSLIRAKFCESIALLFNEKLAPQSFLMGMFSLIDAMLDRSMPEILLQLPIDDIIRNALMGQENELAKILNCCISYEKGEWEKFEELSKELKIDNSSSSHLYLDAIGWGQESLAAVIKIM